MMTEAQKRAMQEGRRRAFEERRGHAEARVRAFRGWLAAGSELRLIPEIPSDRDFELAESQH